MVTTLTAASEQRPSTHPAPVPTVALDGLAASNGVGRYRDMLATTATTLLVFAAFFLQGVIVARILGPTARGEFGTVLYFPRDLFLYVGLLGGIEIIAAIAARETHQPGTLRRAALRLALVTSALTALVSLSIAACILALTGKTYLIPYCLLIALFLPLEHSQLILGAVDRGQGNFLRYNWQRLFYAACFPLLVWLYFSSGLATWVGLSPLAAVCLLFVIARLIGVCPTWLNLIHDNRSGQPATTRGHLADLSIGTTLRRGRPFAWSLFATECFERLDLLLIVLLATFAESGQYFVAVPAAALLTIVPNALSAFAFNAGARSQFRLTVASAARYLGSVFSLQVVAAAAAWALFPPLIRLVFGDAFAPAITFALLLLPASALRGYLQFADAFLKARGRADIGIHSRISSTILMLVFVGLTYRELGLASIPLGAAVGQLWSAIVITLAIFNQVDSGRPNTSPTKTIEEPAT